MPSSIDISVASRFHAFDLARELSTRGMLRCLHTGYPAFVGPRFGVPRRQIRSVWTGEPLKRALEACYRRGWIADSKGSQILQRHDRIVAARLRPGADLFIGWSSQCRLSLQSARRLGMTTVVERGSTHIEWQREQLSSEMKLTGLQMELPSPQTIERELEEYEAADFIAVPSAFSANTFIKKGIPAAKLWVNPYGVDLTQFVGDDCRRSPDPRRGFRVLHVGRVSARKGVHYLAEAVSQVQNTRLTLVGAVEPGMAQVVRSKTPVAIAGAVPGRDLPSWYRDADAFCLLSIEEGLAMVIVQAMAMGLPVIATPNTGAEELIDDGVHGFIVPARDPEAAAVRLRQLADSPELRLEMGRRARARVASGFTWSDYGQRAVSLYQRALDRHRADTSTTLPACAPSAVTA